MTKRTSFRIRWCTMLVTLSTIARLVFAVEPALVGLESLQLRDAAIIPAYTLKVTIDEPVDPVSLSQGNSLMTLGLRVHQS